MPVSGQCLLADTQPGSEFLIGTHPAYFFAFVK